MCFCPTMLPFFLINNSSRASRNLGLLVLFMFIYVIVVLFLLCEDQQSKAFLRHDLQSKLMTTIHEKKLFLIIFSQAEHAQKIRNYPDFNEKKPELVIIRRKYNSRGC